ncbi:hypothetical protein QE109_00140 [Fusibacter bizertensis]|uniref:DUF5050 domain-containing protein n=1 Tax=Fusibacter bizertensis TaxID=1488331 RepID=A0ABT6N803_9FIRM|nr:hypothetical protein [Fusibacter bizertensis]MDH8676527.1 hypothetical protein [Fusibacter bizertensis]
MNHCKKCNKEIDSNEHICADCLIIEQRNKSENPPNLDSKFKKMLDTLKNFTINDFKKIGVLSALTYISIFILSFLLNLIFKIIVNSNVENMLGELGLLTNYKDALSVFFNPIQTINLLFRNNIIISINDVQSFTTFGIGLIFFQVLLMTSIFIAYKLYYLILKQDYLRVSYIFTSTIIIGIFNAILNVIFASRSEIDLIIISTSFTIKGSTLYGLFIIPIIIFFIGYLSKRFIETKIKISLKKETIKVLSQRNIPFTLFSIGLILSTVIRSLTLSIQLELGIIKTFIITLITIPNVILMSFFNSLGVPNTIAFNNEIKYFYDFYFSGNFNILIAIFNLAMMMLFVLSLFNFMQTHQNSVFKKNTLTRNAIFSIICLLFVIYFSRTSFSSSISFLGETEKTTFYLGLPYFLTLLIASSWILATFNLNHFKPELVNGISSPINTFLNRKYALIAIILFTLILNFPYSFVFDKSNGASSSSAPWESNSEKLTDSGEISYQSISNGEHLLIDNKTILISNYSGLYKIDIHSKAIEKISEKMVFSDIIYSNGNIFTISPMGLQIIDINGEEKSLIPLVTNYNISIDGQAILDRDTDRVFNLSGDPLYKIRIPYAKIYLLDLKTALIIDENRTLLTYDLESETSEEIADFTGSIYIYNDTYMYSSIDETGNQIYKVLNSDVTLKDFPQNNIIVKGGEWYLDFELNQLLWLNKDNTLSKENRPFKFGKNLIVDQVDLNNNSLLIRSNTDYFIFDVQTGLLRSLNIEMKGELKNE